MSAFVLCCLRCTVFTISHPPTACSSSASMPTACPQACLIGCATSFRHVCAHGREGGREVARCAATTPGHHAGCLSSAAHSLCTSICLPCCASLQGQDWDFIAHTFWLKHGVAMLFDTLYLAEGITLAYNSGVCHTRPAYLWRPVRAAHAACLAPPALRLAVQCCQVPLCD